MVAARDLASAITWGNCFAQPRLNEASQPGGAAFFRQGIDDMLEKIGTQAPA